MILSVAYVTLADRKGIGVLQRRIGPHFTGYQGFTQPLADAIKLIAKETIQPFLIQPNLGYLLPCITLSCALLGYTVIPLGGNQALVDVSLQILLNMALIGLALHGTLYVA